MEFWRTDSILQVRDKGSRAIFILITKIGQMKKTTSRCGKYNLFNVGLHKICHCLECFHQNEPNSVMVPCYRHGYSVAVAYLWKVAPMAKFECAPFLIF